ncbi:hypothetical protein CI102_10430 [Trichoderma harzianum]|nr:hypothetical protein CI102_10430 [Trichoderma harzianum]
MDTADDVCFHEDCWVLRSTDKQGSKIEALQLFTDATFQAKIFVANINIMATGVNLHDACRVGVIVSQHFNPKRNLQIHERLNRLGQKHVVIWHCLKVKNSFHDHQDRVMLTKWARQLSAESNIKKWLAGALREMILLETMKTYANLVDSNVFMVNTKGIDFEVETTHLIAGPTILLHYIPVQ